VVAQDACDADALSTALLIGLPEELDRDALHRAGIERILAHAADGRLSAIL